MLLEVIYEIYDGLPMLTKAVRVTMTSAPLHSQAGQGRCQLLHPATPCYPFPREKVTLGVTCGVSLWADMNTLGVTCGVLLWADMNAATPPGSRDRSALCAEAGWAGRHERPTLTPRPQAQPAVRGWTPTAAGEVTAAKDGSVTLAPTGRDATHSYAAAFGSSGGSVGAVLGAPPFSGQRPPSSPSLLRR